MPLVGPIDAGRIAKLTEVLLGVACERGTRLVVLDLTGAIIDDPASAHMIAKVFRALTLHGSLRLGSACRTSTRHEQA